MQKSLMTADQLQGVCSLQTEQQHSGYQICRKQLPFSSAESEFVAAPVAAQERMLIFDITPGEVLELNKEQSSFTKKL